MFIKHAPLVRAVASSLLIVALSACSSSDDDSSIEDLVNADSGTQTDADNSTIVTTCEAANDSETASAADAPYFAFASTRAADFSAGFYERISIGDTIELSGCTDSIASSDNVADTDGVNLFGIGRFQQDNITRYNAESLEADYQYSVVGEDGVASNPYDIAFVSESKAYVARYGTTQVWIVNPSAASQEEFFIGEIDLSPYDTDGAAEMSQAVIVGDKLFVLMQRLKEFSPSIDGYIAVIDTNTDTEIATGQGEDGLNGIRLPMRNGMQMFFNEATNDLVVASTGDAFNDEAELADKLTGGVLLVDATDYSVDVLIEDDALGEFVSNVVIASADKGYVVSFTGFGTSFLRAFNPSTGIVDIDPLAEFNGVDITTLQVGPSGNVWVGRADAAENGFDLINPADDTLIGDRVRTELVPGSLVFVAR